MSRVFAARSGARTPSDRPRRSGEPAGRRWDFVALNLARVARGAAPENLLYLGTQE